MTANHAVGASAPSLVPLALIVDPDAGTRKLHAASLEPLAAEVDEAEDGADALAHALVRPPQLVMTELRMPRIDGYTLCGMLRREPATHDATIVVVTASAMPVQIERARRAGADAVVVKPADPLGLREQAKRLLRRSADLRAASADAHRRLTTQIERSRELFDRADEVHRRMVSRTYPRQTTKTPALPPPALRCPVCDHPLVYDHSNVGGVSPKFPEQWDYLNCPSCGTFQYRHRTRRIKKI